MERPQRQEEYWFKRKRYGWGWVPSSREGWMVIILYIAAILYLSIYKLPEYLEAGGSYFKYTTWLLVATIALLVACYRKGESPRWQWGKDKNDQ